MGPVWWIYAAAVQPLAAVLAQSPVDLNQEQFEWLILGLVAACVVSIVFVVRTVQKLATRAILSVLLVAIVGGLWWQREELQDCRGQCECRLFGRDLELPDPNEFCPD